MLRNIQHSNYRHVNITANVNSTVKCTRKTFAPIICDTYLTDGVWHYLYTSVHTHNNNNIEMEDSDGEACSSANNSFTCSITLSSPTAHLLELYCWATSVWGRWKKYPTIASSWDRTPLECCLIPAAPGPAPPGGPCCISGPFIMFTLVLSQPAWLML